MQFRPTLRVRHAVLLSLCGSLGLALAGCVEEQPAPKGEERAAEEVAAAHEAIVNGTTDEGHPAVVALTYGGQPFCSGTLVAPTVVVTAAHCLHPDMTGGIPIGEIEVFFGTDVFGGAGTFVPVTDGIYHQAWYLDDPQADDDVGALRLAEPGPATPVPMGTLPASGTTLTLVGFGITSEGGAGAGLKRIAEAPIEGVYGKVFSMMLSSQGTCSGDSGGTALATIDGVETLVGIHTRSDCTSFMLDERVDAHLEEFILPFIGAPSCASDLQCAAGCAEPDPDCPCAADELCTAACAEPATDPDCDPACGAGDVCVVDCPVADPDCPVCIADGACDEGCSPGEDPDCTELAAASVGAGGGDGAGGRGEGGDDGATAVGGGDAAGDAAEDGGGCAMAPGPGPASASGWALLALFAGAGLRRRRPLGR